MPRNVETVEREREREYNSKELNFISDAQNGTDSRIIFNRIQIDKKDRLCSNIKVVM